MPKTAPRKTRRITAQPLDALLTRIAQEHLFIDTLETPFRKAALGPRHLNRFENPTRIE